MKQHYPGVICNRGELKHEKIEEKTEELNTKS